MKIIFNYKLFKAFGNNVLKSIIKSLHMRYVGKTHINKKYWI